MNCKLVWALPTFSYNNKKGITFYTDSTSAKNLQSKLGVNRRSRHISLRYIWIQDLRQAGEVDIRRITTHENPADIHTKFLPAATPQKHLLQNGFLPLLDGEGEEEYMYYLKNKNQNKKEKNYKNNDNDDNKMFQLNHYYNMHKIVEQVQEAKWKTTKASWRTTTLGWRESERDVKVKDLAYKDLLPDPIFRAQHALQTLQNHFTKQRMRQLPGFWTTTSNSGSDLSKRTATTTKAAQWQPLLHTDDW